MLSRSWSELVGANRYSGLTIELEVLALRFSQKLVVYCGAAREFGGLKVD